MIIKHIGGAFMKNKKLSFALKRNFSSFALLFWEYSDLTIFIGFQRPA